ncbi:potassium-transporting ATPase subunit KdpC [Chitinophaga nivalis]|uniref:Potassium-transporting ATPase KdpC subunit n=1 Tax=Chitinophaga nivalis TaxID=2991709 RepID=A0ABT3IUT7_9BACT|nr:potassium-transporting ATPase subunit KdpC [Chitinophaga nivalis]MCW3462566.1 potassium-transporting ATPase subunit KdpC [Chitinophaga nivalis]MCW3487743.1 potassium-transporting ATPase subunit KdpC [Chitinophaga nivalis]
MKKYLWPSIKLTLLLLVLLGGLYPLFLAGVAKMAPGKGGGVKVMQHGKVVGYENIAQKFSDDKYFQPRPSTVDYNAAGSGGSNKAAGNPDYLKTVQERIDSFLVHNPDVKKADIPAELVTASASGLDPHLTPYAAIVQVPRIAKIRGLDADKVKQLVAAQATAPVLGLFGPATVNVLKLNVALDELK